MNKSLFVVVLVGTAITATSATLGRSANPLTIQFDFAKADLKLDQGAEARFADVAQEMKSYPFAKLEIDGHTDSIGPDQINEKLSQERAEVVRRHFIEAYDVAPARIAIKSHGKRLPVASMETRQGRRQNRVAVVRVYRLEPNATGPDGHNL